MLNNDIVYLRQSTLDFDRRQIEYNSDSIATIINSVASLGTDRNMRYLTGVDCDRLVDNKYS